MFPGGLRFFLLFLSGLFPHIPGRTRDANVLLYVGRGPIPRIRDERRNGTQTARPKSRAVQVLPKGIEPLPEKEPVVLDQGGFSD